MKASINIKQRKVILITTTGGILDRTWYITNQIFLSRSKLFGVGLRS